MKAIKSVVIGLIMVFILVGFAFAQEPIKKVIPNQVTLGWDAVTNLKNGDPIPAGDVIQYEVYVTGYPIDEAVRHNPAAHQLLGEGTSTQMLVTFNQEGDFLLGVRTMRLIQGDPGNKIPSEEISWSDMNGTITPEPFYVSYKLPPAATTGLKLLP